MEEPEPEPEKTTQHKDSEVPPPPPGLHTMVKRTFQLLIALGLLAFLYKYYNTHSCDQIAVNFTINPDTLRVNETVTFNDLSNYSQLQLWKFGDDSIDVGKRTVNHSYQKPGEYLVTLRINDKCEESKKIWVFPSTNEVQFTCPRVVVVGQKVKFIDDTKESISWNWDFGDGTKGTGKIATHVYTLEGVKLIKDMVNSDKHKVGTTSIIVVPKELAARNVIMPTIPQQAPEAPPESLDIGKIPIAPPLRPLPVEEDKIEVDKVQIEEFLMQVSEKRKKSEDFMKYSCGDIQFGVRANQDRLSFAEFCNKIAGKKLKIKEVEIQKNKKGCIIYLKVDYKTSMRLKTLKKPEEPKIPEQPKVGP